VAVHDGAIEAVEDRLVAAIHDVQQQRAVALRGILRAQDREIGGELDLAGGIAGRLALNLRLPSRRFGRGARQFFEPDDDLVARVRGVDREPDFARHDLVGAGVAERRAVVDVDARRDVDADDLGTSKRRQAERRRAEQCTGER